MNGPRVTVGLPAYNNARTLWRAIASVRAQSFEDWKLVISDDQSMDGTWDICLQACAEDARITARRQSRRRAAMNFGDLLAGATTPYFAWLAGDDMWERGFLARTVEALDQAPGAVSALPACDFFDAESGETLDPPDTGPIEGDRASRIRAFLRQPGGTRMYGLFRTEVLRRAFPGRMMNAYDWRLMLGVLSEGAQIAVPEVLLRRERTSWIVYSEMVDQMYRSPLFRRFPALDMSLSALRARLVPISALGDLLRLNLAKHEEYLLVTRPAAYRRRAGLFRRLGLPLSQSPATRVSVAQSLMGRSERQTAGAARILEDAAAGGNAGAALALGIARKDGVAPGDALAAFRRAASLGNPDGSFLAACTARDRGELAPARARAEIVGAARAGSPAARKHLAERTLADDHAGAYLSALAQILEEGAKHGDALMAHALGRLVEARGLSLIPGHDPLILYEAAAPTRAEAALDAGRLRRDRGEAGKAEAHFRHAAHAGIPGAALALADTSLAATEPPVLLHWLLEAHGRAADYSERAAIAERIEGFDEAACLAVASRRLGRESPGTAPIGVDLRRAIFDLGYLQEGAPLLPGDLVRLYGDRRDILA